MTRQREVVDLIPSAMLPRDDVLNVVGEFAVFLTQQAVLATVVRSTPDSVACVGVHC